MVMRHHVTCGAERLLLPLGHGRHRHAQQPARHRRRPRVARPPLRSIRERSAPRRLLPLPRLEHPRVVGHVRELPRHRDPRRRAPRAHLRRVEAKRLRQRQLRRPLLRRMSHDHAQRHRRRRGGRPAPRREQPPHARRRRALTDWPSHDEHVSQVEDEIHGTAIAQLDRRHRSVRPPDVF